MEYNGIIKIKSPKIMYAVKNDRGEIMLSTLAGTEMACRDWFVQGTKLKFNEFEDLGYLIIKLLVTFEDA